MTRKNDIIAIVVTYNRCELLLECIEALRNQTYKEFDILVIDNASTDGTAARLQDLIDQNVILYYNTGINSGGAGGFNFGIRKAYEMGYEYFWLMDDDTIPYETALGKLLTAKKELNDEFGYLCSNALWTDESPCKMNVPQFAEKRKKDGFDESDEIIPIVKSTFVSFFVSRRIVAVIGLPIKEFFIWADDTNYCWRINRISKGYLVPKSRVIHKMKTNSETNIATDDSNRLERYVYAYRNRYFNYRMIRNLKHFYAAVLYRIFEILLFSDHKTERIRYMLKGFFQGIRFNPEIEYVE